jgi:hypothetical protein
MKGSALLVGCALTLLTALPPPAAAQETPEPACRLDSTNAKVVQTTLELALAAFKSMGKPLPFDAVAVNPSSSPDVRTMAVYVVKDATVSTVNASGCITKSVPTIKGEELDKHSVRGGCLAAGKAGVITCSADAVKIFGRTPDGGKLNPALLYVLSHELGHVAQGRPGEYAGRLQTIDLASPRPQKLAKLQDACEPGMVQAEEDADRQALEVLKRLVPNAPFREPLFSQRGSALWSVDQLNLAANAWSEAALAREFDSQPQPHKAFVPTEFPTPSTKVQANAKAFVCEVLTKKTGRVSYPGRSATHPALEVRIQRVAQGLRQVAAALPANDGSRDYEPVAKLQPQLSEIFNFMYRETGVYMRAIQASVCTRVNSDKPEAGC